MAEAVRRLDEMNPLLWLVLRRVLLSFVSFLVVSVIIFTAVDILPGDTAQRALGREATAESVAILRSEMRLSDPAIVRYGRWLGDFVSGDLGTSMVSKRPVADYLVPPLRHTLLLGAIVLAVHIPLSLFLGLVCALTRDTPLDLGLSALVLVAMSVPDFVVGIFLIVVFSVELGWFPPLALIDQATSWTDMLYMLTLPILALNAAMTAYVVRQTRDSMIEVLNSDFVRVARLRGLPPLQIVLAHALPSALGPAINAIALNAAWLVGGIVVIEAVFNYPGLGRLLVEGVRFHDVPIIQAIALILSGTHIALNLAADIGTTLLNPKLRTRSS
ncbi:ABC transporter permease [Ancylobacter sp. Lp-2]|uniref:ABC transporter permease n=1 Tax=Ancylobacter sp. Lp-2 TaxID=2881339 RepID=UPI001E62FD04|nr:ABC transporter permease [Ancylobacter sp. Lp-2]MCB4768654.1 ABC transporter permease [Ancylobacter sp. Lp-2]